MNEQDGINGTDNIARLFPDQPSTAGIPPQPEVIAALERFMLEAASGKHTGLVIIGFDGMTGQHTVNMTGKLPFSYVVTALEQIKFSILARDFGNTVQANLQPK